MKARIKKLWIKALRSGKYEQGKGALRVNDAFCCLGVLCDLHAHAFKKRWKKDSADGDYSYDGDDSVLPKSVQQWAGIDDADPVLLGRGANKQRAAELNDSGRPFDYIAERIEKLL